MTEQRMTYATSRIGWEYREARDGDKDAETVLEGQYSVAHDWLRDCWKDEAPSEHDRLYNELESLRGCEPGTNEAVHMLDLCDRIIGGIIRR